MPGYGPPPAENRRRRNADTFEESAVTVPADGACDAPKLPNARKYLAATRDWYAAWCEAPQAAAFLRTDWQRLHMLAPLVDEYWREPSTKLLSEIRLNESLLGATHVDRMRGRIKVEQPKAKPSSSTGVSDLDSRRRRLTDAS